MWVDVFFKNLNYAMQNRGYEFTLGNGIVLHLSFKLFTILYSDVGNLYAFIYNNRIRVMEYIISIDGAYQ